MAEKNDYHFIMRCQRCKNPSIQPAKPALIFGTATCPHCHSNTAVFERATTASPEALKIYATPHT